MNLSLVVLSAGRTSGTIIRIPFVPFLVGRDSQCHLRPASPLVGRRHCALLVRDGEVYLRDFGSSSSYVNDQEVKGGERRLRSGDVLTVGPLCFQAVIQRHLPGNSLISSPASLEAMNRTGHAGGISNTRERGKAAGMNLERKEAPVATPSAAAAILEKYYRRTRQ